jgi:hypothetical protein
MRKMKKKIIVKKKIKEEKKYDGIKNLEELKN